MGDTGVKVREGLRVMFHSATLNPGMVAAANKWLTDFQASNEAWEFCVATINRLVTENGSPVPGEQDIKNTLFHFTCSTLENKMKHEWRSISEGSQKVLLDTLAQATILGGQKGGFSVPAIKRCCVATAVACTLFASALHVRAVFGAQPQSSSTICFAQVLPEEASSILKGNADNSDFAGRAAAAHTVLRETALPEVIRLAQSTFASPQASPADVEAVLLCLDTWAESAPEGVITWDGCMASGLISALATFGTQRTGPVAAHSLKTYAGFLAGPLGRSAMAHPQTLQEAAGILLGAWRKAAESGTTDESSVLPLFEAAFTLGERHYSTLAKVNAQTAVPFMELAAVACESTSQRVCESSFGIISELRLLAEEDDPCMTGIGSVSPYIVRALLGIRRHTTLTCEEDTEALHDFREQASLALLAVHKTIGVQATQILFDLAMKSGAAGNIYDTEATLFCLTSFAEELGDKESDAIVDNIVAPLIGNTSLPRSIYEDLFQLTAALAGSLALKPAVLSSFCDLASRALQSPELAQMAVDSLVAISQDYDAARALGAAPRGLEICSSIFARAGGLPFMLYADLTRLSCKISKYSGARGIATIMASSRTVCESLANTKNPYDAAIFVRIQAEIVAALDFSPSELPAGVSVHPVLEIHSAFWPLVVRAMQLFPSPPKQKQTHTNTSNSDLMEETVKPGDVASAACHFLRMEALNLEGAAGTVVGPAFGDLLALFKTTPRSCVVTALSVMLPIFHIHGSQETGCTSQYFANVLDQLVDTGIKGSTKALPDGTQKERGSLLSALFSLGTGYARFQPVAFYTLAQTPKTLFNHAIYALMNSKDLRVLKASLCFLTEFVNYAPPAGECARFVTELNGGYHFLEALFRSIMHSTIPQGLQTVATNALKSIIDCSYAHQFVPRWFDRLFGGHPKKAEWTSAVLSCCGKGSMAVQGFIDNFTKSV